ncbi:hypothetical protein [Nocardia fluminea]|uniref:hypothetical protein n=1 Tax=Nocardia fluminea TaxID=134984 RepID=UPI00379F7F19
MSTLSERKSDRAVRASLIGTSGFVALWAFAGAVGLAGGGAELGAQVTAHLPFDSPVFAGCMLALIVGLPMSATATATLRADLHMVPIAFISGLLLIGWVAVQPLVIGRFHWLQPIFGVLGLAVCALAYRLRHRPISGRSSTGCTRPAISELAP